MTKVPFIYKKSIAILAVAFVFIASVITPIYSIARVVADDPANDIPAGLGNKEKDRKMVGSLVVAQDVGAALEELAARSITPSFVEKTENEQSQGFIELDEDVLDPKVLALRKNPNINVLPSYEYGLSFTPNDPNYVDQWSLPKISAPEAWGITTGSADTVIAVIDSGVLFEQEINGDVYTQPDLPVSRMWANPLETGMTTEVDPCWSGTPEDKRFNGCDDSGNGLVDDWRGWDFTGGYRGDGPNCPNHNDGDTYEVLDAGGNLFVLQDNDPQPYSCDSSTDNNILNKDQFFGGTCAENDNACFVGHGTMVAGVAAAETNNAALIAGIDHQSSIMNLRVFSGYGSSTTGRIAAAVNYAVDNGADVINMSLGGTCSDESFRDALLEEALAAAEAQGVVSVAASGNNGFDTLCYPATSHV